MARPTSGASSSSRVSCATALTAACFSRLARTSCSMTRPAPAELIEPQHRLTDLGAGVARWPDHEHREQQRERGEQQRGDEVAPGADDRLGDDGEDEQRRVAGPGAAAGRLQRGDGEAPEEHRHLRRQRPQPPPLVGEGVVGRQQRSGARQQGEPGRDDEEHRGEGDELGVRRDAEGQQREGEGGGRDQHEGPRRSPGRAGVGKDLDAGEPREPAPSGVRHSLPPPRVQSPSVRSDGARSS